MLEEPQIGVFQTLPDFPGESLTPQPQQKSAESASLGWFSCCWSWGGHPLVFWFPKSVFSVELHLSHFYSVHSVFPFVFFFFKSDPSVLLSHFILYVSFKKPEPLQIINGPG